MFANPAAKMKKNKTFFLPMTSAKGAARSEPKTWNKLVEFLIKTKFEQQPFIILYLDSLNKYELPILDKTEAKFLKDLRYNRSQLPYY